MVQPIFLKFRKNREAARRQESLYPHFIISPQLLVIKAPYYYRITYENTMQIGLECPENGICPK